MNQPRGAQDACLWILRLSLLLPAVGLLFPSGGCTASSRHPFILFRASEIRSIRARIARPPYDTWWDWVRRQAEAFDGADEADWVQWLEENAFFPRMKQLAFAWVIAEKPSYAAAALSMMIWVDPAEIVDGTLVWPQDHRKPNYPALRGADHVRDFCEAYDLMGGFVDSLPAHLRTPYRQAIEAKIRRTGEVLADESRRNDAGKPLYPDWYAHHKNNWQIRQYSALGLVGLILEREDWRALADRKLEETFARQIAPDGTYAEGPTYLGFSAQIYVPYFLASRHAGKTDWFAREPIRRVHRWIVEIRMPDGRFPPVDDAFADYFPSHWLTSAYPNEGIYRWDFLERDQTPENEKHLRVESLSYYDDTRPTVAPPLPASRFFPQGGVVLRGGWERDDLYLYVSAESGTALNGGGHEHEDALSFILWAHGEMLTLDPGYGGFDRHGEVMYAGSHSTVLFGGVGPGPRTAVTKRIVLWSNRRVVVDLSASYEGGTVERRIDFDADGARVTFRDVHRSAAAVRARLLFQLNDVMRRMKSCGMREPILSNGSRQAVVTWSVGAVDAEIRLWGTQPLAGGYALKPHAHEHAQVNGDAPFPLHRMVWLEHHANAGALWFRIQARR